MTFKKSLILFVGYLFSSTAFAKHHTVHFTVDYKTIHVAGKDITALAINNQLPAPTLHFKQGDQLTIIVHNHLREETAIHWHGILVPWQMDGVLGISQHGIAPGESFQYQFTLHQAGTYWYHSHAGLQEQQGLYGAFIIDPIKPTPYHYNKDIPIVLSDWINTLPDQVLANLKKSGDYYSVKFPLQASLSKFIHDYHHANLAQRQLLVSDYKQMQHMRMGLYDFSDVAYDAFLLNGQPNSTPWRKLVRVGDTVRLRFIGASAGTIFHVKIPDAKMQIVHVEGNDVQPHPVNDFSISPGETYDVLVKIEKNSPYIIYAESSDTLGAAVGALVTSPTQAADYRNVTPFPEPLPVTQQMMAMMNSPSDAPKPAMQMSDHTMNMDHDSMDMSHMHMNHPVAPAKTITHKMDMTHSNMQMHHGDMSMPTESSLIGDHYTSPSTHYTTSSATKYQALTAAVKTNNPNKPIAATINMELYGYMDHYIWFINGIPEYNVKPLIFKPGKRYRLVFTNTSMMHHPMHIHGHWLILRKGDGAYDPLLHTIDVAPGATVTADVDTDASGQWFFHCHMLYHMTSGMARVIQYSTLLELTDEKIKPEDVVKQTAYDNRPIIRVDEARPIDMALVHHPMAHPAGFWFASRLKVGADFFNNRQLVTFKGLYGPDYHKLELFMNDAETDKGSISNADMDIFYWHLLSQFWAVKGGVNYMYRPASAPYWQPGIGIEGLMPYFIDTDIRGYYYAGSAKLDVELQRDTQITNNFFIQLGIRGIFASKTVTDASIGSGLNQSFFTIHPHYRLIPGWDVFAEYEHRQNYGSYKNIQSNNGDAGVENTYSLGLSVLF